MIATFVHLLAKVPLRQQCYIIDNTYETGFSYIIYGYIYTFRVSSDIPMVELKQPWTQTSWRWHVPLRLLAHQSCAITSTPLGLPYWGF